MGGRQARGYDPTVAEGKPYLHDFHKQADKPTQRSSSASTPFGAPSSLR